MRITIPHHSTKALARKRLEEKIDELLSQFGGQAEEIHHEWVGDALRFRGKAKGMSVEGKAEVTESELILEARLPLLARPFEGRIRQAVEREAEAMFRTA